MTPRNKASTTPKRVTKYPLKTESSSSKALIMGDASARKELEWQRYQSLFETYQKAENTLKRFENEDQNQYFVWVESQFGNQIAELRDLSHRVDKLYEFQEIVSRYSTLTGLDEKKSYRMLKQVQTEKGEEGVYDAYIDVKTKWEEEEYQEAEEDEYSEADEDSPFYQSFKEFMHSKINEHNKAHQTPPDDDYSSPKPPKKTKKKVHKTSANPLKDLYHKLIFRLHPDRNQNQTEEEKFLFHATRAAYTNESMEELEQIWLRLENQAEGDISLFWRQLSIGDLMERQRILEKKIKKIKAESKHFKDEPAWNFLEKIKCPKSVQILRTDLQYQMDYDLRTMRRIWTDLMDYEARMLYKKTKGTSRASKKIVPSDLVFPTKSRRKN